MTDGRRSAAYLPAVATLLIASGLVLITPVAAETPPSSRVAGAPRAGAIAVGSIAPDFVRADLQGRPRRLGDYRGKVVLLNFWATWCEPCRAEMHVFSRWQRMYGADRLQVLGVSMDDEPSVVVRAVREYKVPYPIVMGDEHLGDLYGGVLGLPLSYLIDATGHVVARYQGEQDITVLRGQLETLLPRPRR